MQQQANAAFFGLGAGARGVPCGARLWLRCLARLYAAAPVNPLCSDAVPRGRAFTEAGLGLRAPGSGRRGKQPSDRSGRCLRALVRLGRRRFVFRARGERSSPHARRPGTAGRGRGPWGLGMTARRWRGVAQPIGPATADAADVGRGFLESLCLNRSEMAFAGPRRGRITLWRSRSRILGCPSVGRRRARGGRAAAPF